LSGQREGNRRFREYTGKHEPELSAALRDVTSETKQRAYDQNMGGGEKEIGREEGNQ